MGLRAALGKALALLVVGCWASGGAAAGPFDAIYVFGDSLVDAGNAYRAVGLPPSPPYFNGHFSSGPVWTEDLAGRLGLSLAPSLAGGTDYAFGGSLSGPLPVPSPYPVPSLLAQVGQFAGAHPAADPSALYVIAAGANDVFEALTAPAQAATVLQDGVGNVTTAIATLAAAGARNFLISNVADVGLTPFARAGGAAAASAGTALASAYSSAVETALVGLRASVLGSSITSFDFAGLEDAAHADPQAYGYVNVSDPCLNGTVVCATPDQYLFWDDMHPTARGHAQLADAAYAALLAAGFGSTDLPEPPGLVALGLGFAGLALLRTRQRRSRPA